MKPPGERTWVTFQCPEAVIEEVLRRYEAAATVRVPQPREEVAIARAALATLVADRKSAEPVSKVYRPPGYDRDDGWEYWPQPGEIVRRWRDNEGRRCTSFLATLNDSPCADFKSRDAFGVAIVDALQANAEPWDRDTRHTPRPAPSPSEESGEG